MRNPESTADEMIEFLNEAASTDPVAIGKLIDARVPCNKAMLEHPTIQASQEETSGMVGFLGILNGMVGTIPSGPKAGYGYISALMRPSGACMGFTRTEEID